MSYENPRNYCSACGEDFTSVTLFDTHHIGRHEYTFQEGLKLDPPVEDGRRCLDKIEMLDKGWIILPSGLWSDPARTESARIRFGAADSPTERPEGVG